MQRTFKQLPAREELSALFAYDERTGILVWRARLANRVHVGDEAGTVSSEGYLSVGIRGVYFGAHRIIWKMMTGNDPGELVDHRDGDGTNNRWANLREATDAQNQHNRRVGRNNKSGVKGVFWIARRQKWCAVVSVNGRLIRVGHFDNLASAGIAVNAARSAAHGAFARAA